MRGEDKPGNPDVLYGRIYYDNTREETVVGLQFKWLFLMEILQGSDSKPTEQLRTGIDQLSEVLDGLKERWSKWN